MLGVGTEELTHEVGHPRGVVRELGRREPRVQLDLAESLARGADLFNRGLFWEAHEAWEEAWLELEDEPKLFVQGLIQVAAGYHKATVQNQPRGCVKLLTTALEKLEQFSALGFV